ncbi:MAG: hypothetical protein BWY15_01554 [Firmicutes bacterium ADurb.Bin193]|nr:MAG: hypothetical protein BWY15_01554 [Firmicutes bacterium ADurb.Bin193]
MKTLSRYGLMAMTLLKINIQRGLEYPAHLIGWLISNPLQFIFGLITIKVVISNFQALGGWSFEQTVFLYGLGIISHGLSVVLFIQTWYMGFLITEGELDRMLVRPLNVFFQFCFFDFNFIGLTDMLPGIIIFTYGCMAASFQFTLANTLNLLLALVGATALRGGLYTIIGALSFWIQRSRQLIGVQWKLFDYSAKYPMNIYPPIVQGIFTFLLPIGFICFYPASQLLYANAGFALPGNLCLWTFAVGIGFYMLGMMVFKIGLRWYESCGS